MRFLVFLSLLSLLLHSSEAKSKKSGWNSALHDLYEFATDGPKEAFEHIGKAVNPNKIIKTASGAFASAADTVSNIGKKTADGVSAFVQSPETNKGWEDLKSQASSALGSAAQTVGKLGQTASDHVSAFIQSPEVSNGWEGLKSQASSALGAAAQTVGQISQKASEHVSEFVQSPAVKDGWNELTTRSAQAGSAAYEGAATAADSITQKWSEVAAAKPEGETWPEYVWRLAGEFTRDNSEEKKELAEYVFFWKAAENEETWSEAGERFAQRFNYRSNEDVKRTANFGFASAISTLAGSFRQVNAYGEAIYKLVGGWGWGMRQINTAGAPIFKPSLFGSAFSGIGSIFWYGSVLGETVNMVNAINEDMVNGTTTHTVHASSKAVLSWTGAATGASAGAALFSFVPVIGPLAGGIAGGFAGAYSGGVAGEAAANAYTRAFEKHN